MNVGEQMTQDDFLQFQDIACLDRKHKRSTWCLHTNLTLSIQSWVYVHLHDVFYFQDASEGNGSCPFHHRDPDTYATLGHAPI